jgi:hypothetical protein
LSRARLNLGRFLCDRFTNLAATSNNQSLFSYPVGNRHSSDVAAFAAKVENDPSFITLLKAPTLSSVPSERRRPQPKSMAMMARSRLPRIVSTLGAKPIAQPYADSLRTFDTSNARR